MNWEFAIEMPEARKLRISCEGDLHLSGDGGDDICATVAPADSQEDSEGLHLTFADDVNVAVPPGVDVEVVRVHGDLRARRLNCGLTVQVAEGDAGVRGHSGGVVLAEVHGDVAASGVNGGLSIESVLGDAAIKGGNGGATVASCVGDLSVVGQNGGVHATSVVGDAHVTGTNGGLTVESVAGDLHLGGHSGGVQVGSAAGDLALKGVSGGVQITSVGGDVFISGMSGGLELGDAGGDLAAHGLSGSLHVRTIAGDMSGAGLSGGLHVEKVGGDVGLEKVSGELTLDEVAGYVTVRGAELANVVILAHGDIELSGKIDPAATCELTSEGGGITLEIPADPPPVVVTSHADGETRIEIPTADPQSGGGPRLLLSAAEDLTLTPWREPRRRRRHRTRRERRHIHVPIPDIDQIVHDVMEPFLGEKKKKPSKEDLREERLMVLRMVEGGKVSAEQGAQLLEALGEK